MTSNYRGKLSSAIFDSLNVRFGKNDYQHQEVEGDGEVGTIFDNQAWEARAELVHQPFLGFSGNIGLQASDREFSAIGEEAFVPPVNTSVLGVYWVGERNFDHYDIELGARYESVSHRPSLTQVADPLLPNLDFSTFSSSLGVVARVSDSLKLSALADLSSRAPSIEELFSKGPHLATRSYEVGNSSLEKETALGLSVVADYQSAAIDLNGTVYLMQFEDFIYQANTGELVEDLPVFIYQQDDASFLGFDLSASIHLGVFVGGDMDLTLQADSVRAELDPKGAAKQYVPRIPSDRYGIGLAWKNAAWSAKLNYFSVSEQDRLAEFELKTAAYTDLSIHLNRSFEFKGIDYDLFFNGRNLTNQEQRMHSSIVKDIAPAPGRRIELGVRLAW